MDQVKERFVEELDTKVLLNKVRDSYELLRNLLHKEYFHLMQYHRKRVIDQDTPDIDLPSMDDVSSAHSYEKQQKNLSFNDQMKLAVVRGLGVDIQTKTELKEIIKNKDSKKLKERLNMS